MKIQSGEIKQRSDPETWVEIYGDYLYRYALSWVKDEPLAEDMVQETFLAALRGQETFESRSSERTWLTSILKHRIVDHLRKTSRMQPWDDMSAYAGSTEEPIDERGKWKIKPQKWEVDPERLLERKTFWKTLHQCLSELPDRMAQAFKLREMEGLGCEEICKVFDITSSNSKE